MIKKIKELKGKKSAAIKGKKKEENELFPLSLPREMEREARIEFGDEEREMEREAGLQFGDGEKHPS